MLVILMVMAMVTTMMTTNNKMGPYQLYFCDGFFEFFIQQMESSFYVQFCTP